MTTILAQLEKKQMDYNYQITTDYILHTTVTLQRHRLQSPILFSFFFPLKGSKGPPGPKGDDGEPGDSGLDVSCFQYK